MIKAHKIDLATFKTLVADIIADPKLSDEQLYNILKKYPKPDGALLTKTEIAINLKDYKKEGSLLLDASLEAVLNKNIRMKAVRTISGVTPVTVLTKPYPCPGKCIFCPNDVRMPKSYLSDEPGAQRAERNKFDPYFQTFNRLLAFKNMGHSTDKIELLVLGGTWSFYPETYQIWFIKRCFDALNDFENYVESSMLEVTSEMPYLETELEDVDGATMAKTYNRVISQALVPKLKEAQTETSTWEELFLAHATNEHAKTKCIGLVIETRPDEIDLKEVIRMRKLGATRVQIGVQSLNDDVLVLNKRGHDVAKTQEAFKLLRSAGFKILAHWMPNLYGSTPELDILDFQKLFDNPAFRPDELKVYPCSLIESAELMKFYKEGLWKPYSEAELLEVLLAVFKKTPNYCRLTRVIRDIPSPDIVVGNKKTNFRQLVEATAIERSIKMQDIRAREIRDQITDPKGLKIQITSYDTLATTENFIEFVTKDNQIVGFLRLSLPSNESIMADLGKSAVIREVHVYGKSLDIGKTDVESSQHIGLGKALIKKACDISNAHGYKSLGVISSIGTRAYYAKLGFKQNGLYQIKNL